MSRSTAVKSILQEAIRQTDDRLEAARHAPRCMHVRANGVRCGCPAMRQNAFCFFHDRLYNRPYEESFPFLEDAASIQMAIMQVLDGLRRGKLDRPTANSLFFGLQTASANLKRAEANLQPFPWKVVTEDPVDEARAARRKSPASSTRSASAQAGSEASS